MDDNNKKSFDILVDINQLLNDTQPSMYQGRTPAFRKFFGAWARRTLEQDYLETLINYRINVVAHAILKENPLGLHPRRQDEKMDIFLKGVAYGAQMIYGDIKKAATNKPIKSDEDK